jgi:hypothetical protein
MRIGLIGFSFAIALGLAGTGGAAQAMPAPGGGDVSASDVTLVAQGCGPGMNRGPRGGCLPNYGRRGYGPPRHGGAGCVMQRTPYGVRRICRY